MRTRKVIFIADLFRNKINGGAESNDATLISYLRNKGYEIELLESAQVTPGKILLHKDDIFIIGNFTQLSEASKSALLDTEYIIYEHDHKYLKTRNPSLFPSFNAPKEQIQNKEFYEKAKKVVVLSEICKKVIENNLFIDNVHSIGCSLWTEERFSLLEKLSDTKKEYEYGVVNSSNPIKGREEALRWCNSMNITTRLIAHGDEEEFLKQLAQLERLVFMPQVLETFSRLAAEAKMLNCKLVTKKILLGFASEKCYDLSGKELIGEMRKRVSSALLYFEKLLQGIEDEQDDSITVILNSYRRHHLLEEQVQAIKNQTVPVKDIWVWVNEDDIDNNSPSFEELKKMDVKIFKSNFNWKFYGRFSASMLARTKFVALFDDDTIPGKRWLENCLKTYEKKPGILGGVGVRLKGSQYKNHTRIGWSHPNSKVEEVDLVGHAWFLKKDVLQYLWREEPITWDNGEDIQLSYLAQKYGGVKTYVPPQIDNDNKSSIKGMEYGVDKVATSNSRNHEVFYTQRDKCVKIAKENGWKTAEDRGIC